MMMGMDVCVLDELAQNGKLKPSGILGIFPAERNGDDIAIYGDEARSRVP